MPTWPPPLRRFFYAGWLPFVPRNDVNFIAFDNTLETRCRLVFDNAVSELKGHRLHIIFVEV